jgi:Carboxypeptidase regulatory-like domain
MGTVIRGRVVGPDGSAMPGARVYFKSGPGVHADIAGLTSEAGEFALFAPNPGVYEIESVADGFEPAVATVETADDGDPEVQVDVRLGGGGG